MGVDAGETRVMVREGVEGGGGGSQFRMGGGESEFIFTSQTVSQMQPQFARSPVQVRRAAGAEVHCGSGESFRPIRGAEGGGGSGLHAQPVQGNSFTQAGRCS